MEKLFSILAVCLISSSSSLYYEEINNSRVNDKSFSSEKDDCNCFYQGIPYSQGSTLCMRLNYRYNSVKKCVNGSWELVKEKHCVSTASFDDTFNDSGDCFDCIYKGYGYSIGSVICMFTGQYQISHDCTDKGWVERKKDPACQ